MFVDRSLALVKQFTWNCSAASASSQFSTWPPQTQLFTPGSPTCSGPSTSRASTRVNPTTPTHLCTWHSLPSKTSSNPANPDKPDKPVKESNGRRAKFPALQMRTDNWKEICRKNFKINCRTRLTRFFKSLKIVFAFNCFPLKKLC